MTKFTKRNLVLVVTALFVLVAPSAALAGGKGGGKQAGGNTPKESISLNYGKVEYNKIKNKAGPSLYNKTTTGKHYSKTAN